MTLEIREGALTQINVFTCRREDQDALVASLTATIDGAAGIDGWIGAAIHASTDGTMVTNYIQYRDTDAITAVLVRIRDAGHLGRNLSLGRVAGGTYRVAAVRERR